MITIVTHNGKFHLDDILACATLKLILDEPNEIIRTRDPKKLEQADYLVDVGGEYNPREHKFDHHFRDGQPTRENGIKYSSFGLVWKDLVLPWLEEISLERGIDLEIAHKAWAKIDKELVEYVDALDNGQLESRGKVFDLASMVNSFAIGDNDQLDANFMFLVLFMKSFLASKLEGTFKYYLDLQKLDEVIDKARENRDEILVLDEFISWRERLVERNEDKLVKFVVFPDASGDWRVQCVPPVKESFEMLVPLPEQWRGKRGKELEEIVGIKDLVFCHPAGFIAGAKTREAAIQLAKIALDKGGK